jgi:hypothetical protein
MVMPLYRVEPAGGAPVAVKPGARRVIRLMPSWMLDVQPGDLVRPLCDWNKTTGNPARRLANEVKVHAVRLARGSQHGVLYAVRDQGGQLIELSSGWFVGIVRRAA